MNILSNFKLGDEKEDFSTVAENIEKSIYFRGSNLWILVFAVMIASLGLNLNSTAVVIGAMLVSPLMGPIMGLGFGMAVNDINLVKKSFYSYLFAGGVGLVTSTFYFLISPLNDAHSEILSRTSPNIYDVLIALFGGLAGILATSSKLKGNVIPGVAIATALMPPLCTAGFGLATLKLNFFIGAFYLFLINSVFIAFATFITARLLNYPYKHIPKEEEESNARRIFWIVVLVTIIPSVYFGYDMVEQNRFVQKANSFVEIEAVFPNDYLLKKTIDPKNRTITLVYGGENIDSMEIEKLKIKLEKYYLKDAALNVQQGFAYLQQQQKDEAPSQISLLLSEKEKTIQDIQSKLDSIEQQQHIGAQLFRELQAQYPGVSSFSIQQSIEVSDSAQAKTWLVAITTDPPFSLKEQQRINEWLKVRVDTTPMKIQYISPPKLK